MDKSDHEEVVAYMESGSDEVQATDLEFYDLAVPINNSNTSFIQRFAHLYNFMKGMDPDVTFEVGPDKVPIRAHRILLAVNSPVFRSMFFGGMDCGELVIVTDCSEQAFNALVQFCYKEECGAMTIDLALDYLYTAKKYLAAGFENHCCHYLERNLEVDRVFEVLSLADFYILPTLSAASWKFLEAHPSPVMLSHLDTLSEDMLLQILRSTNLEIEEALLFQITLMWIKRECVTLKLDPTPTNLRSVGLKALKLIRFPTIPGPKLASVVAPTGIFTDEELSNFFIATHTPELSQKPKSEYSFILRHPRKSAEKASDVGLNSVELRSKFIVKLVELIQEIKPSLATPFDPMEFAARFSGFGDLHEVFIPAVKAVFEDLDELVYEL